MDARTHTMSTYAFRNRGQAGGRLDVGLEALKAVEEAGDEARRGVDFGVHLVVLDSSQQCCTHVTDGQGKRKARDDRDSLQSFHSV